MDLKDQVLLSNILRENADQYLRHKLLKKYNLYYRHWLDYCLLVSCIAMIGLMIALIEWEMLYPLHGSSTDLAQSNVFSQWIIVMTSFLGVLAIIIKYRMEATWRHYDNPMKFYRKLVR